MKNSFLKNEKWIEKKNDKQFFRKKWIEKTVFYCSCFFGGLLAPAGAPFLKSRDKRGWKRNDADMETLFCVVCASCSRGGRGVALQWFVEHLHELGWLSMMETKKPPSSLAVRALAVHAAQRQQTSQHSCSSRQLKRLFCSRCGQHVLHACLASDLCHTSSGAVLCT